MGVSRLRLRIPGARSLKEKRSALRPVVERIRRLGVSCAEVADQDVHGTATIAVAAVSADGPTVDRLLAEAARVAEGGRDVVLETVETERR